MTWFFALFMIDKRMCLGVKYTHPNLKGDIVMRIQFELDDDVVGKIDRYAKMQGLNRTTFIRACIGEKLMTYERLFGIVEKNVRDICLPDGLMTVDVKQ